MRFCPRTDGARAAREGQTCRVLRCGHVLQQEKRAEKHESGVAVSRNSRRGARCDTNTALRFRWAPAAQRILAWQGTLGLHGVGVHETPGMHGCLRFAATVHPFESVQPVDPEPA